MASTPPNLKGGFYLPDPFADNGRASSTTVTTSGPLSNDDAKLQTWWEDPSIAPRTGIDSIKTQPVIDNQIGISDPTVNLLAGPQSGVTQVRVVRPLVNNPNMVTQENPGETAHNEMRLPWWVWALVGFAILNA